MRLIIVLILLIVSSTLSYFAYTKYINPNTVNVEKINEITIYTSNKTPLELEIEEIRKIKKEPKSINSLSFSGWIPDWDMVDGFNTLKKNPNIKSVSPFWFDLNEDGSLKTTPYTNWKEFITYTQNNSIELVPSITSFDRDKLTKVLNSNENTDRFIKQVIDNVIENNYDGIDLDFEHIYINDQKLLLDLVKRLNSELESINKVLHFSLLSKWSDLVPYGQTKASLDYKALEPYLDELKIQGYGYSIAQDPIGPIGPLIWLEDIIRYVIKIGIPREKIVLGIHTYTMDWSVRETINYQLDYFGGQFFTGFSGGDGVAYYGTGVKRLLSNYSVKEDYVESWGEVIGRYNFNGQERAAVYPNDRSIEDRKKLTSEYGIKGISYWRLGDEGDLKL